MKHIFDYMNARKGETETLRAVYDRAVVHTRGKKPEGILTLRRPSEPVEIMDYRLAVYEPITRADFRQAITDAKRALMSGRARLETGPRLTADLENMRPGGQAWQAWAREKVLPMMFEDPNASIVFWPTNPGAPEALEAVPLLINSFAFTERSRELLKWPTGENEAGEPLHFGCDTEFFWIYEGAGKDERATAIYQHGLGRLPAVYELGGVPATDENGFDYLESYFDSAFAWGNKAISADSDLTGSKTLVAYPIRQIQEEPCQNPVCEQGQVWNEATHARHDCQWCNGKGVHIPSGPYAYIVKRRANDVTGEGRGDAGPAMSYITPPVEGLQFLQEDFWATFKEMKRALNQLHTAEAQSGRAKEIDREGKHAGIDAIGAQVWAGILKPFAEIYRDLKYGPVQAATGTEEVVLIMPDTFREKSGAEMLMEAQAALAAGDRIGAARFNKEAQARNWGTDLAHQKFVEAWGAYNPLAGYSFEEKLDLATAGMGAAFGFGAADFLRAGKGEHIIRQMQAEPGFIEMPIPDILAEADRRLGIE